MKSLNYLWLCIGLMIMLIAGCSNESSKVDEVSNLNGSSIVNERPAVIEEESNKIIVQKRVGEENKYEMYEEITDEDRVGKAKNLLDSISWEKAKVLMENYPDYKFHFVNKDGSSNYLRYELWISPNKDKVNIVVRDENLYAQVDKNNSAELLEILVSKDWK